MKIKKALITAAGPNQRTLPLQTLVDRDGTPKATLGIVLEEAIAAGIEEIGIVVCPGDEATFASAAGQHARRIRFLQQHEPRGHGHAVLCGRAFIGDEPFLLLVGDHVYVSRETRTCAQQLVEVASANACSVSAVQATHEAKLPFYGAVGGRLAGGQSGLYDVAEVLEKPTPTEAEQRIIVPGLRAGHYLCFFGMHVLTPVVMDLLEEAGRAAAGRSFTLTEGLSRLARKERYRAFEVRGRRYDIGARYGLLTAQLALSFEGADRDEVLANLVELLAHRCKQP